MNRHAVTIEADGTIRDATPEEAALTYRKDDSLMRAEIYAKEFDHYLSYFKFDHLPEHLRAASAPFHALVTQIKKDYLDLALTSTDGFVTTEAPEFSETIHGIRKILEAKDCIVRARLPYDKDRNE